MIRRRVLAVLELRDSVTGMPVPASAVRIRVEERRDIRRTDIRRLDKGEGIICLVDEGTAPAGISVEIHLSGPFYLPEMISFAVCTGEVPIFRRWLLPTPSYPVPSSMAKIIGAAKPGTKVFVVSGNPESLKLSEPWKKGDRGIHLYHDRQQLPEGRFYLLKQKGKPLLCRLGGILVAGKDSVEYELLIPPGTKSLEPAGLTFCPASGTFADETGNYQAVLLLAAGKEEKVKVIFKDEKGKTIRRTTVTAGSGKTVRVDEEES